MFQPADLRWLARHGCSSASTCRAAQRHTGGQARPARHPAGGRWNGLRPSKRSLSNWCAPEKRHHFRSVSISVSCDTSVSSSDSSSGTHTSLSPEPRRLPGIGSRPAATIHLWARSEPAVTSIVPRPAADFAVALPVLMTKGAAVPLMDDTAPKNVRRNHTRAWRTRSSTPSSKRALYADSTPASTSKTTCFANDASSKRATSATTGPNEMDAPNRTLGKPAIRVKSAASNWVSPIKVAPLNHASPLNFT